MYDNKDDNGLSPEEREKFAALSRARMPSPALENRIISTLKAKGLIDMTSPQPIWTLPRLAGACTAALVLLTLGFGLGKWQSQPPPKSGLPIFLLLLYESGATTEHEADKVVEYSNWAKTIGQAHQLAGGEKLQFGGRLLHRVGGELEVRDIAANEEHKEIGGYFLIQARDYEEAVKIAAGCPHLKYGGLIELRQIDKT